MNHEYVKESEEELIGAVSEKIAREVDSYLLKDYEEVLKSHGGEEGWKTPDNIFPVAAQIILFQYIEQNFGTNAKKKLEDDGEKRSSLTDQCRQIAIY